MGYTFNLILAILLLIFMTPIMIVIAIFVKFTSQGTIIYWSKRLSRNRIFMMPKFRSLKKDTPVIDSNSLKNPHNYLTPIGGFLRRYSLDELPQIFSVIKGDMHLVGPRPAIPSENLLNKLRKDKKLDKVPPGITGWAQINGRDKLSIYDKVALDYEYVKRRSVLFDLKILWLTIFKVVKKEGIRF